MLVFLAARLFRQDPLHGSATYSGVQSGGTTSFCAISLTRANSPWQSLSLANLSFWRPALRANAASNLVRLRQNFGSVES
ncbi:hypothetical protein SDJN03_15816, partial [Cucurbita argyrosperma subsp. sororia]